MKNKNILIVDDIKTNIDVLVDLLDDMYDIVVALDGKQAIEIVKRDKIDIILLDIMMPDMDGYEVCKILKSDVDTESIPVIFITAKTDEDSIEKAYDIGGVDYVTKPFKPKELLAKLKREIKIQTLIDDLKSSQEELKLLVSIDPMTELFNRRYFSKTSEHILELAKRENKNLSVVMIDIDNFKNINDTYGHIAGDRVLESVAKNIQDIIRAEDTFSRISGDEFSIIIENITDQNYIDIFSKKLLKAASTSVEFNGDSISVSCSIGISSFPDNADTKEELIHLADTAMYRAKKSGKSNYFYCH